MSLLGFASCLARLSLPVLLVELVKIVIDIILTVVLMGTHNLAECLDVLWIILDAAVSFLPQPIFPTLGDELWVIDIGNSRLRIILRMNEVVQAGIDDVDGGSIRTCSIHLDALQTILLHWMGYEVIDHPRKVVNLCFEPSTV